MSLTLTEAAQNVQDFERGALGSKLASLESAIKGLSKNHSAEFIRDAGLTGDLWESALLLKQVAGQINVVIHAIGIISSLPYILDEDEVIDYVSLGAGNTGRLFDLETNQRVAEFKFIQWRGGPESIRQNQLFKDLFYLAEHSTDKLRCMYTLGTQRPLQFLNSRRSLNSVMSRNQKLASDFRAKYGNRLNVVRDYHSLIMSRIHLYDLISIVPHFNTAIIDEQSEGAD